MQRKEGIKILVFILFFFIILMGVSYVVRTNGDVKNRFTGFYAQKKNTIDVMLFGASPVGTSLSPGYMWGSYGFTSYPLSSNTQRPKAIKYLLEEGYRFQNPEVVVIELRMFTYEDNQLIEDIPHIREVTDNMRYSMHRIETINGLVETKSEPMYSFYFDIFKFHSNWKMLFLPEELAKVDYKKEDINKGFQIEESIAPIDKPEYITDEIKNIPKEQQLCLEELMDFLDEHEQQALFLVTPEYYPLEYQKQMNYMKQIIENRGFNYLNLNEHYDDMGLDFQTDFYDGSHTNILGAKKCSDYVGRYLKEHYHLEDGHEKTYDNSWDESYQTFMEYYEQYSNQTIK